MEICVDFCTSIWYNIYTCVEALSVNERSDIYGRQQKG